MKNILLVIFVFSHFYLYSQNSSLPLTLFKDDAGRPEYSPDGNKIAYHKKMRDGYYDIFICNSDGSGDTCITCNHPELPNKHIGQPSWHPNQKWLVFQAEKKDHVLPKIGVLAAPGIGYHNDVYILNLETGKVYQLTNLKTKRYVGDKTPSCGILQPHFSPDGKKLSWSERYDDGGDWGKWRIVVYDFIEIDNRPVLKNPRFYQPGSNKGYYESNDFINDSTLIICGNLESGQNELGIDIYLLNLNDSTVKRLTHTLDYFDECPHPNKTNTQICYLSTEGFENQKSKQWWNWAKGEFWLMNIDGSNKHQITFFNTPGHPHYTGNRTIPAYIAWSPDGSHILLGVVEEVSKRKLKDKIYKIRLKN
jgi:Tol biopolymer transport system component